MSGHHYVEEIQIYILPIDFRRFLEEGPEIRRNQLRIRDSGGDSRQVGEIYANSPLVDAS